MITPEEYRYILQQDFMSFIHCSFYELNPQTKLLIAPYIEVMATKLEACRQGKIKRLIINLPPRYLKSHCASIAFVAWLLGHRPSTQIICASYGQSLSDKLALDCRKIMLTGWYQLVFKTRLDADKQAVSKFMTTDMGFRMATSIGGVITGHGADFIIIDDPLKPEDALSEVGRNAVNNWFDSTLLSRLNNKTTGCIIIIMQRLHQDDLVGHVMGQDQWEVVSFPSIAEKDEEFRIENVFGTKISIRKEGEPLHGVREDITLLEQIRQRVGSYTFSSQYQQNPQPVGGALVKNSWLQYYDPTAELPTYPLILQSWDTANKGQDIHDYSVCTTWGVKDKRYTLLHVLRKRLEYPELKRAVIEMAGQFKPHTILIEDKASGTQLIQDLKADGVGRVVAYIPPAGNDKTMRLFAQTALFENGQIFLPQQATWLEEYRNELISFPGSKFDDQVDSTTQALDYLKNKYAKMEIWSKLGGG